MRYKERKDQSAELLRLALAEMGRHDASFTPTNFTVWYEHVAGINPRLSAAITLQLKTEARFSNDTVERLHREFIAEIDGAKAERISDQFQQVMTRMVDAVEDTGDAAQAYGGELNALQAVLSTDDQDALEDHMQAVLDGTQRMVDTVQSLKDRASESQREIDALRADLERARIDATTWPLVKGAQPQGIRSAPGRDAVDTTSRRACPWAGHVRHRPLQAGQRHPWPPDGRPGDPGPG